MASANQVPTGSSPFGPGPRTRVRRHAERADYERAKVYAVIDETFLCHVAFTCDGAPCVLPMAHARDGDSILLHGARSNRLLAALLRNDTVSLAFTLLDGLVFARSALRHSMNYRSVVGFGRVEAITSPDDKRRALTAIIDHMATGRSAEIAPIDDADVAATAVVRVVLEEASLKARSGPPVDVESPPQEAPVYAGVLPLGLRARSPQSEPEDSSLAPSAAVVRALLRCSAEAIVEQARDDVLYSCDPQRLDFDFVHSYLSQDSYWARGLPRAALVQSLARSVCVGAYVGDEQVAFARALTDGARFAIVADVFVRASQRGRGIGKAIVQFLLHHPLVTSVPRVFLGTRDAHGLYERFGFERHASERWMVRDRGSPQSALTR